MSLGSVFLLVSFLLFLLLGLGLSVVPRAEAFAFAFFVLGLLVGGWQLPPWPRG
jgi:hypothetical protein